MKTNMKYIFAALLGVAILALGSACGQKAGYKSNRGYSKTKNFEKSYTAKPRSSSTSKSCSGGV